MKFRLLSDETEEEQAWNKKAASFSKKPLKNQVLFVSPRADGHLEEMQRLYILLSKVKRQSVQNVYHIILKQLLK